MSRTGASPSGGGGGGGGGPVTFKSVSRPATIALAKNITTAGDSVTFGVGAPSTPSDASWPAQLVAGHISSGTVLRKEVSGMAMASPGGAANTNPIPGQISGQGATPLANNTQVFDGGLNDYNTAVNPEPGARTWAYDIANTTIPAIAASLTGGSSQAWIYLCPTARDGEGPGMTKWASWRWLYRNLQATYGARIFDVRRAMQFRCTTNAADIDRQMFEAFFTLPTTFRGSGNVEFAQTVETAWNTIDTTPNNPAQMEVAAPPGPYSEGALIQNINSGLYLGGNIYRKTADGHWSSIDTTHPSRWGYAAIAEIVADIAAALQGSGAAIASPAELKCRQDDAANTTVGTIYYIGAAPTVAALFDEAGTAITTLTLTDNGSANGFGSMTVKRSASGTLTEGEQRLILQTEDGAGHVLHSPVDFYIGQPSTQAVPRMWLIPGTSGLPDSDFSMCGRDKHGLADGDKFFTVGWLKPSVLPADQYFIDLLNGHGTNARIQLRITTGGSIAIAIYSDANVLMTNIFISNVFGAGVAGWFALDIDLSPSTPTVKGYINRAGDGVDTAVSKTGIASTGGVTLPASKMLPRFFALYDASHATLNFAAQDTNRKQFHGSIGMLAVGAGNIGIDGNPTLARTLWNLDNTPVARAPFATIGGLTPVWDIQGGIGDYLHGGFNPVNEPIFGTYRGVKGFT